MSGKSASVSEDEIIAEAKKIVDAASRKGITLRIMGAAAVRIHCQQFLNLHKSLKRELTDIDLMGYSSQGAEISSLLESLGYLFNKNMRHVAAILQRYIFKHPVHGWKVDVFFDKLEMCHTIDFRGRLELEYPTITVSDILLEKLQIVKINEKDIKDIIVLLREHEISESEKEAVNKAYISKLLSKDWGFYYTATLNLKKICNMLDKYGDILSPEDASDVLGKINCLLDVIEKAEKSSSWKLRAKIGPRVRWYRDVEEVGL